LHNNCSGKHAGFLCLARHLGVPVSGYLDPASAGQVLVRRAVAEMAGLESQDLGLSIDGCSAPCFRLPLAALGRALARVASPSGLPEPRRAACERMLRAVADHPELIAGTRRRLCTDLVRASRGRLFPKIGGDTLFAVGVRGAGRALVLRLDDAGGRGLPALVVALCERFGFLAPAEAAELGAWRAGPLTNWAGLVAGRLEVFA
jgi:L-asparaginase II